MTPPPCSALGTVATPDSPSGCIDSTDVDRSSRALCLQLGHSIVVRDEVLHAPLKGLTRFIVTKTVHLFRAWRIKGGFSYAHCAVRKRASENSEKVALSGFGYSRPSPLNLNNDVIHGDCCCHNKLERWTSSTVYEWTQGNFLIVLPCNFIFGQTSLKRLTFPKNTI